MASEERAKRESLLSPKVLREMQGILNAPLRPEPDKSNPQESVKLWEIHPKKPLGENGKQILTNLISGFKKKLMEEGTDVPKGTYEPEFFETKDGNWIAVIKVPIDQLSSFMTYLEENGFKATCSEPTAMKSLEENIKPGSLQDFKALFSQNSDAQQQAPLAHSPGGPAA